jgi:hypothetical protein
MQVQYSLTIKAFCPVDPEMEDEYALVIRSDHKILVEHILKAVEQCTEGPIYQEELTCTIQQALGGNVEVETIGLHSGVRTLVVCKG